MWKYSHYRVWFKLLLTRHDSTYACVPAPIEVEVGKSLCWGQFGLYVVGTCLPTEQKKKQNDGYQMVWA